jgi:hypothetical protein
MASNRLPNERKVVMKRSLRPAAISLALLLLLAAVPVFSQEYEVGTDPHRHLLTTNPFLFLFNWYNVEYELRVANHSTVGFAGSYVTFDDDEENDDKETYAGGSIIYRYYAQGDAPGGFYLGGRLGYYTIEIEEPITGVTDEENTFGFGIDVGYTFLMGDTKRFAISIGAGVIRYFGGDLEDAMAGLPIIRLVNVGFRF